MAGELGSATRVKEKESLAGPASTKYLVLALAI
jgi:hypothetical protein